MAKDYPSKAKEKSEENPTTPRQNLNVKELEAEKAKRRKDYKKRVTEPRNKERDKKVGLPAPPGAAPSAQRNINIIPEPTRKGNMPALPEFSDRFRKIRPVKVVH
jgi:hypothetical protein